MVCFWHSVSLPHLGVKPHQGYGIQREPGPSFHIFCSTGGLTNIMFLPETAGGLVSTKSSKALELQLWVPKAFNFLGKLKSVSHWHNTYCCWWMQGVSCSLPVLFLPRSLLVWCNLGRIHLVLHVSMCSARLQQFTTCSISFAGSLLVASFSKEVMNLNTQ